MVLRKDFAIIISYVLIILLPIYIQVTVGDHLFGGDVPQYLLTASDLIRGKENIFDYPYPLVPLLYILPSLIVRDPLTLYVLGLYASGLIMVLIVSVMYQLLKNFVKTDIGRLMSIMLFGTFPLTLDVIGWGGQSALVATLFGLIATIFMIQHSIYRSRAISLILCCFALLMSTLSEPYISIYFIVLCGMFVLWNVKHCSLKSLLREIISLLPSSIILIFTTMKIDAHGQTSLYPLGIYMVINPNPEILNELLTRLTFNNIFMYLALIIIVLTYAMLVSIRVRQPNFNRNNIRIVVLTAIVSLIQILITPAQYADRGLFLISIPLAIMVGEVLDETFHDQDKKEIIRSLGILLTIFITLNFMSGINIYSNALGFYYVDKQFLKDMLFMRYEDGDLLFISPYPWTFPLAYITEKNIYPSIQPVWFVREQQINASILALTLAWGIRWIEAGEIRVVDATPVWAQPSPAIVITKYPYYVELFRLSDGLLPVTFSPTDNKSIIWNESPFYAKKIETWNTNTSMHSIYKFDNLVIRKDIWIDNADTINILLNYVFINSFPHEVTLRIISLMLKDTKAYIVVNNSSHAIIELLQSFKEPFIRYYYKTIINAYTLNPNVKITASFIEQDEWDLPEIIVNLNPIDRTNNMTVLLKVRIDNVKINSPHVVLEYNIIKEYNIRWIVITKNIHQDIVMRFQKDPLYEIYKETPKYIIFKVKSDSKP